MRAKKEKNQSSSPAEDCDGVPILADEWIIFGDELLSGRFNSQVMTDQHPTTRQEKSKSANYVTSCGRDGMTSVTTRSSLRNPSACMPLKALRMHEHSFVLSGVRASSRDREHRWYAR